MSEHWYWPDGRTCYTVTGKNGKERDTTLRDAKKLGLVPSVTTIIRQAYAPQLEAWKIEQAILSALTLPKRDGERDTDYVKRIKQDAQEQARKASEKGTEIHDLVEQGFKGVSNNKYYISVKETIRADCGDIILIPEHSFATNFYGGKIDLHNCEFLFDVKSTDKDLAELKLYDNHFCQLSPYDFGVDQEGGRKCGIIYVNSISAESRLIWATDKEIDRGWDMFHSLMDYWYYKTGLGR